MGSDKEFILRGRSFIYIVRNEDSRIDAWRTPQVMEFYNPNFLENLMFLKKLNLQCKCYITFTF